MKNGNLFTNNLENYNTKVGQASRLSEDLWRRHLTHFQIQVGYYFITFTTYKRIKLQPLQKNCIFNAIHFLNGKKYDLYAVVVLNDHIHMIINPMDKLSKIMHSIKSFTVHEINKRENRKGRLWQDENFDKVIRNEREFVEKIKYIINNPIKEKLAEKYINYKWLYIKGWINNN